MNSLYQQHKQRPCHLLLKHLVTLTMDCVMDGVSHPQTYLTGDAKEEVLPPQIRGLHQITPLETVHTILYIHTYIHACIPLFTVSGFARVVKLRFCVEIDYII